MKAQCLLYHLYRAWEERSDWSESDSSIQPLLSSDWSESDSSIQPLLSSDWSESDSSIQPLLSSDWSESDSSIQPLLSLFHSLSRVSAGRWRVTRERWEIGMWRKQVW